MAGEFTRGRRAWTVSEEEEAVARFAAGEPAAALAAEYGVTAATLHRSARLAQQGRRRSTATLTAAERQAIAARYAAGEPPREIAPEVGLAANDVARVARAEGVPAQRPTAPLTAAEKAHCERRAGEGASARTIGEELGRGEGTVARYLDAAGVGRRDGRSARPSADRQAAMVAYYATGVSIARVAATFEVSLFIAGRVLDEHGVRRRRPKPGGVR